MKNIIAIDTGKNAAMHGFKYSKLLLKYGVMIRKNNVNHTITQKIKNKLMCLYRVFITFSYLKGLKIDKYRSKTIMNEKLTQPYPVA